MRADVVQAGLGGGVDLSMLYGTCFALLNLYGEEFFFFNFHNLLCLCNKHLFANLSLINLVSIFRCSSSKTNPVYGRLVNSFVLVCSLSSHRHLFIPLIFGSRFIALSIHNKLSILNVSSFLRDPKQSFRLQLEGTHGSIRGVTEVFQWTLDRHTFPM
jgi:hypothetical protein